MIITTLSAILIMSLVFHAQTNVQDITYRADYYDCHHDFASGNQV